MRRTSVAVAPLVVSLVIAACSGDSTTTTSPRAVAKGASQTLLALSCPNNVFNTTMPQDAKAYFPAKDPVFDSIPAMKKLEGSGAAAATPMGFFLLSRVVAVRNTGKQIGSAAAGGKFVLDVVGCMSVGPIDDTFKPDLALANGVFELKGGADSDPALAKVASVGNTTVNASPLFGAEPFGVWTRAGFPTYLVYGYPTPPGPVTVTGFDMGTLPQSISEPPMVDVNPPSNLFRVALCIPQANGNKTTANRLIHNGAIVTGLGFSGQDQGADFCLGNIAAMTTSSSWLGRLASNALSLLSPKSAFAMDDGLGIGGLPDGWSPQILDPIQGSGITISFQTTIHNTFADTAITVVLKATDPSGTPLPAVGITLSVSSNNGVPAGAIITPGFNPTGTTGTDGTVTITVAVHKAGGFVLAANGQLSLVPTPAATSNQFQVQNK